VPAGGTAPAPEHHLKDDSVLLDRDGPGTLAPSVARTLDAATAFVALILVVVVASGVTGPPRLVLALAFVSFVPGWAVVGRSQIADGISKLALAVATSLTVCTATALAMAWLRTWHPFALFYALAVASVAAVLRPPPRPGPSPARVADAPTATPAPRLARPDPQPLTLAPEPVRPAPRPGTPAATRPTESPTRPRRPRRHTVQPENLRLTDVAVRVVTPMRPSFTVDELTDIFAGVHDRHPFTDLHLDSDAGAVMEGAGSRRLEIRRDSIDYREGDPADFEAARANVVALVDEVRHRLGVATLANLSCHLQARWRPDTAGDDPSSLFARAAGVDPRNLALLGSTEPVEVGLRFTGRSDDPAHDWTVVVEPDAGDGSIRVDVVSDFGPSVEGTEAIGEHLQQAHRFLTEKLAAFVESIVASPTGEH